MITYFTSENDARKAAPNRTTVHWEQRGHTIGWLSLPVNKKAGTITPAATTLNTTQEKWSQAQPIHLPGFALHEIEQNREAIQQADRLLQQICADEEPDALLDMPLYQQALTKFEMLGSSEDLDDLQEIAKIDFDHVANGSILAEDLWVKVAWLSLQEGDASMRFRFSYGMEGEEDVAADLQKQQYAADLCEALFPESRIISQHAELNHLLQHIGIAQPAFVERIVYFNAPGGGALFHQDVERGHKGVVYTQLSGETFWLTLSKTQLLDEITHFLKQPEHFGPNPVWSVLTTHTRQQLSVKLDQRADDLEQLLNQTPAFSAQLVQHGHGYWLTAGDMLLLPQFDQQQCAWHAVYGTGKEVGEGLSFAVRDSRSVQ